MDVLFFLMGSAIRRLILVQWDNQIGPTTLLSYPPCSEEIIKEAIMKIWAFHEMNPKTDFYPCSIPKKIHCFSLKIDQFFLLLELNSISSIKTNAQIYHEILQSISNDVLKNLDSPNLNHIFTDIFHNIKNFTDLKKEDLFFKLFDDSLRVTIFKILQEGPITKNDLKKRLNEIQLKKLDLDIYLSLFIYLSIISIQDLPGTPETIFLLQDIYYYRKPSSDEPFNREIKNKISKRFNLLQVQPFEILQPILRFYIDPNVRILMDTLERDNQSEGTPFSRALLIIDDDLELLRALEAHKFISFLKKPSDNEERVYLLNKLDYSLFKPTYLLDLLPEMYQEGKISMEQMLRQIELIV